MSVDSLRREIARLQTEIADLKKKRAAESSKKQKANERILAIDKSITKTTPSSSLKTKYSEMSRKEKEAATCEGKIADFDKKIADKENSCSTKKMALEKEEQREATKKHSTELKHEKDITREKQMQRVLQAQISQKEKELPIKIKVLFCSTNPTTVDDKGKENPTLKLDREVREIENRIRLSHHRDSIEVKSIWAVQIKDLFDALNAHDPEILHISGHGNTDMIFFEDPQGNPKPVTSDALSQIVSTMTRNLQLVVLNSCYSAGSAQAVINYISTAIGMANSISDEAAIIFAGQFYSAIGFGRSIQTAFDQAKTAILAEGLSEDQTPQLFHIPDINPNELCLVKKGEVS